MARREKTGLTFASGLPLSRRETARDFDVVRATERLAHEGWLDRARRFYAHAGNRATRARTQRLLGEPVEQE
jgi:hypothetical protein